MQTAEQLYGLTSQEVAERRAAGRGTIAPPSTGRSYAQIIREDVFTFVNNVLFILCLALLLMHQYSEAMVSVAVVLFNVIVSVIQEVRAKRKLDQIALLTRPRAIVVRDAQEQEIDPGEIVQDDLLIVRAGDQIVVDGPVIETGRLDIDESLLTGEADAVAKQVGDMLFSGSFCVTGNGYYRAEKLGVDSFAGNITSGARSFRRVFTPLQRYINLIIQSLLLVALYIEVILAVTALALGTSFLNFVRMSVVVVGIVPIGLLLATSVAYALSAVRMAQRNVLVQHLSAVESLSNVNVLCLDKTGTLTANALELEDVHPLSDSLELARLLLARYVHESRSQNATSMAIAKALPRDPGDVRVREEIPFSSVLKWSALNLEQPEMSGIFVLGAPEMLMANLAPGSDFDDVLTNETARGLRVLLFAFSPMDISLRSADDIPQLPTDLQALALVSLRDQLRPHVRETLEEFSRVGVQIKVISGDSPQTVGALARQIGISGSENVVSGLELAKLDTGAFAQRASEATIFGRITPQQKEQLVKVLRRQGSYVAMIGDGVNDVLSLKQAQLGIAMSSGSQATRGVADLVLLNDSFGDLPYTVAEGQRVRNGMQSVICIFLARVFFLTLLLLVVPIVGGFPFEPKQKSLLTFMTASLIVVALASWARPGPSKKPLHHTIVQFVLPAAFTISLGAYGVYLLTGILYAHAHLSLEALLNLEQTALTAFAVITGLLLVPFVVPPLKVLAIVREYSGDWRPTLLAAGLMVVFVFIVLIEPFRTFFSLGDLDWWMYLWVVVGAFLWLIATAMMWYFHVFERFLQLSWRQVEED